MYVIRKGTQNFFLINKDYIVKDMPLAISATGKCTFANVYILQFLSDVTNFVQQNLSDPTNSDNYFSFQTESKFAICIQFNFCKVLLQII